MEVTGLHLTVGGLATLLGIVGSAGSIWRFLIKPRLDAQAEEQERARRRQINVDLRLTLLEAHAPESIQVTLRQLREDLLRDLNDG